LVMYLLFSSADVPSTTSRTCNPAFSSLFFFNDAATSEIYTLSLHDALPISEVGRWFDLEDDPTDSPRYLAHLKEFPDYYRKLIRSEEHTSELQSRFDIVCRLLLEKKKTSLLQHTMMLLVMFRKKPFDLITVS